MTPLDYFFYPFLFLTGLCFGSFFNVVALRVPVGKSIIAPPSSCPHCNRRLNALDLLPVAGYLIRKGRCAGCRQPIAPLYPINEFLTGALFVLAYDAFKHQPLELLASLALVSLSVIVSTSDLVYTRIPNAVLLVFLPLFLAVRLLGPSAEWLSYLAGGLFGFFCLFLIAWIKPGAMGMGDVKLLGVIGLCVGWQHVLLTLFLGSAIGVLASVVLMLAGKVKWKGTIPFGPSLCAGAVIAQFGGEGLVRAYLSMFSQM